MDKEKLKSLLILPHETIKTVMKRLDETAEKILFVVNKDGKLLGTITDGDIRRALIKGIGFDETIDRVMCNNFTFLISIEENKEEKAKQLMLQNKFEQIPLINEEGVIVDVILWIEVFGEKKVSPGNVYKQKNNKVVIMAGGKGTRLDPFTRILPKPLVPIGDRPVIEIIMEIFSKYGYEKFIYTLNYKKEYIKLYLQESKLPYEIEWIEEPEFLGTAGSLTLLKDRIEQTFFVVNCDSILDFDYEKILAWHKKHDAILTIVGCHNEIKVPYGVLELSNGNLLKVHEKPTHDVIINTGIYVMEPKALSYIPESRQVDMNEVIDNLVKYEKVAVYPISSGWFDIGQWEEYKNCLSLLSL